MPFIDSKHRSVLQETVELLKRDDTLVCLIHPFAESYTDPFDGNLPNVQKASSLGDARKYLKELKAFIANLGKSPILVAEEEDKVNHTRDTLRRLGYTGEILFYATQKNYAMPVEGNFHSVVKMISETGKKRLYVAGQYFYLDNKNLQLENDISTGMSPTRWLESPENIGCIEGFIRGISKELQRSHIQIALSSIALGNIRM